MKLQITVREEALPESSAPRFDPTRDDGRMSRTLTNIPVAAHYYISMIELLILYQPDCEGQYRDVALLPPDAIPAAHCLGEGLHLASPELWMRYP